MQMVAPRGHLDREMQSLHGDTVQWRSPKNLKKWNSARPAPVFTAYGKFPKNQALRVVRGCLR